MTEGVFTTASDAVLVDMIRSARERLVFAAPAASDAVATALAERFREAGPLSITVILDPDPEVYRLGYGSPAALKMLHATAADHLIDLRMQPGLRVGIVAVDASTLVFAPIPLLVEAGSATGSDRPNAVMIGGAAAQQVAEAAGGGETSPEIGCAALPPAAAAAVESDLRANPPQPFDIARAVRVFSSAIQYVELEVSNCRFASRQVTLPPELLDLADAELQSRISGRIRPHEGVLGRYTVVIETADGPAEREVDEKWVAAERKRIEDRYTFVVPRHGRVLMRRDREAFDAEVERFETNVGRLRDAIAAAVAESSDRIAAMIVAEFLPRWQARPPEFVTRWGMEPSEQNLRRELDRIARRIANEAVAFDEPMVRHVYKEIAPESVSNTSFIEPLCAAMRRKKPPVPETVIEKLFERYNAARGRDTHSHAQAAPEAAE